MKFTKIFALLTVTLFMLASTGNVLAVEPNALPAMTTSWQVDETTMVYEITNLEFNSTQTWPVFSEDGESSYQIGEITTGDLMFMRPSLPSLNPGDTMVYMGLGSTGTYENWGLEYDANFTLNPAWPVENNGPVFLAPAIPVPSDGANWNNLALEWSTVSNIAATNLVSENLFNLKSVSGNGVLNVSSVEVNWDLDTGLMKNYTVSATENDGTPYTLELEFQYFRDEAQWDLGWGVHENDLFVMEWETLTLTGAITPVRFGDPDQDNYINQGDLMLFKIFELASPMSDGGLHWNGSAMTQDFETEFTFEFQDIGTNNDGPRVFLPIIPIGNSNFLGNITNEFEASGATVTVQDNILNVTYNDVAHESAEWDLTTGLLQRMLFDGEIEEGHLSADLTLVYYRNLEGGVAAYGIDNFEERYVVDQAKNGSSTQLTVAESIDESDPSNPISTDFNIYEGDILQVSGQYETDNWGLYIKTSSGYQIQGEIEMWYPGFEFGEGPPALYFVIPNTVHFETALQQYYLSLNNHTGFGGSKPDDAFFVKVDSETTTMYVVNHTDDEFGFTATRDGFTVSVLWDKATGLLNYYKVEGTDQNTGNQLVWEMHRSEFNIRDPSVLDWGVAAGTFTEYNILLVTGTVEFGDTGAILSSGDVVGATITDLGDFETEGPSITVDLTLNDITDRDVQMGLVSPGFEFTDFDEYVGGPPLLYFAIPIGDDDFFDTLAGMYNDAGYNMARNGTHFGGTITITDSTITGNSADYNVDLEVYWEKATGLLSYYSIEATIDGSDIGFTIVKTGEDIVPTSNTDLESDDAPSPLPVNGSAVIAIPFMGFAVMILRRRRN